MAFKLKNPHNPRIERGAKTASTAYSADSVICPDADNSTDAFTKGTTTTIRIMGILQQVIASTDSDYATTGAKKNYLIDEDGEWLADVGTGTPTANYEQYYVDLADELTLATGATTYQPFYVTRFISASLLIGKFTGWAHRYSPAAD